MYKGIDCASRLSADAAARAKAAGFDFAGRYLVPETYGKALTKPEAEAITSAGLRILTVFETTADRVKGGANAGALDGFTAYKCARAIDMPESGIIYFAVDYDAGEFDFPAIAAYLSAARGQTGPYDIGVYGSYRVVEAMAARGVCRGFWQCVAWSSGAKSPALTVYQARWSGTPEARAAAAKIGVSVDLNECPDMLWAGIWTYGDKKEEGEDVTGEEIYNKLYEYLKEKPVPDWAKAEFQEAINAGITDGMDPMCLVPRYQAAIMALRAKKAALRVHADDGK